MQYTKKEFEPVYRASYPRALGLAMSFIHSEDEARDIVQDAFFKLWEGGSRIANPEAYVYRIVRNTCLNRIASTPAIERFEKLYPIELEVLDDDTEHLSAEVDKIMRKHLSPRELEVIQEVYMRGNSYKEAAANLQVSVSAINKNIVNALRTIRMHFKSHRSWTAAVIACVCLASVAAYIGITHPTIRPSSASEASPASEIDQTDEPIVTNPESLSALPLDAELVFEDTPLSEIAQTVEEKFGVEILIPDASLGSTHMYMRLPTGSTAEDFVAQINAYQALSAAWKDSKIIITATEK